MYASGGRVEILPVCPVFCYVLLKDDASSPTPRRRSYGRETGRRPQVLPFLCERPHARVRRTARRLLTCRGARAADGRAPGRRPPARLSSAQTRRRPRRKLWRRRACPRRRRAGTATAFCGGGAARRGVWDRTRGPRGCWATSGTSLRPSRRAATARRFRRRSGTRFRVRSSKTPLQTSRTSTSRGTRSPGRSTTRQTRASGTGTPRSRRPASTSRRSLNLRRRLSVLSILCPQSPPPPVVGASTRIAVVGASTRVSRDAAVSRARTTPVSPRDRDARQRRKKPRRRLAKGRRAARPRHDCSIADAGRPPGRPERRPTATFLQSPTTREVACARYAPHHRRKEHARRGSRRAGAAA